MGQKELGAELRSLIHPLRLCFDLERTSPRLCIHYFWELKTRFHRNMFFLEENFTRGLKTMSYMRAGGRENLTLRISPKRVIMFHLYLCALPKKRLKRW